MLSTVAGISKKLAAFCNVVVVVSDANAALAFNTDSMRKIFLCVDDLSFLQGLQMCKSMQPPIPATNKQLLSVFRSLGSRPSMLLDLHRKLHQVSPC